MAGQRRELRCIDAVGYILAISLVLFGVLYSFTFYNHIQLVAERSQQTHQVCAYTTNTALCNDFLATPCFKNTNVEKTTAVVDSAVCMWGPVACASVNISAICEAAGLLALATRDEPMDLETPTGVSVTVFVFGIFLLVIVAWNQKDKKEKAVQPTAPSVSGPQKADSLPPYNERETAAV